MYFYQAQSLLTTAQRSSIRSCGVSVLKERSLANFFDEYLKKGSVFGDKSRLQTNYKPEDIPHRDLQLEQVGVIIRPALRLERPSNFFVYGKTGTGKTLVVTKMVDFLIETASGAGVFVSSAYVNCKLDTDTVYGLFTTLAREAGINLPSTGLSTDDVSGAFFSAIDKKKQVFFIVLDEIDHLIKKAGDDFLYKLTRQNEQLLNAQVAIIGISNDLMFADSLDPRVKSSLSQEELVFPPYNAVELQDILNDRTLSAFAEGALETGVVEKCAAYAAREHGDARRALDLLRVAGELADRKSSGKVSIADVDGAEEKIERDKVADIVSTQPKQAQVVLFSIISVTNGSSKFIFTGEVYEVYRRLCQTVGLRPLTQRRVSDILSEFDMLGVITARVISKGRHGRTREIMLAEQAGTVSVRRILQDALGI